MSLNLSFLLIYWPILKVQANSEFKSHSIGLSQNKLLLFIINNIIYNNYTLSKNKNKKYKNTRI